jgi:hypothetical protein
MAIGALIALTHSKHTIQLILHWNEVGGPYQSITTTQIVSSLDGTPNNHITKSIVILFYLSSGRGVHMSFDAPCSLQ